MGNFIITPTNFDVVEALLQTRIFKSVMTGSNSFTDPTASQEDQFFETIKKTRPFYFGRDMMDHFSKEAPTSWGDTPPALPFDVCTFFTAIPLSFSDGGRQAEHKLLIASYTVEQIIDLEHSYNIYVNVLDKGTGIKSMIFDRVVFGDKATTRVSLASFNLFLDALKICKKGETGKSRKVKIKTRHGKEWFKTNKVIFCSKSKNIDTSIYGHVDWKHSWEVMGHWRKVSGLGKDPSGKIISTGYTWVVPHVKGDGPLVVKARSFNGNQGLSATDSQ